MTFIIASMVRPGDGFVKWARKRAEFFAKVNGGCWKDYLVEPYVSWETGEYIGVVAVKDGTIWVLEDGTEVKSPYTL